MRRTAAPVLAVLFAVAAAGCAGRGHHLTARELQAERLVQLQVGEDVSCLDTHAVNEELLPDYPVNYICRNADDQIYAAVVTPDGVLTSLSGPARLSD